MKKILTALIALSLAAAMTACGSTDDPSSESAAPKAAEQTSSAAAEDNTAEKEEDKPEESAAENTAAEDTSAEDTSEAEAETDAASNEELHKQAVEAIKPFADVEFTSGFDEKYTFMQLYDMGLANITAGMPYCLVPEGASAGSSYYTLHYTEDGQEWKVSETFFQTLAGKNFYFAADDGNIVKIEWQTAETNALPKAIVYSLDVSDYTMTPSKTYDTLFNELVKKPDGGEYTTPTAYQFDVTYDGGKTYSCVFMDIETEQTLFDGQITLPD